MQPTGSTLGLRTLLGQTLSLYDYNRKNLRNQRWSFGIQQEITRDLQIEINYVGQRASHLITSTSAGDSGRNFNGTPNGSGLTYDQAYYGLGSRLNATLPNPFRGLIPAPSALAGNTITVAQLLMPYPEFGTVAYSRTMGGTSYYNSLQFGANKRMGHGLSGQFAYTYSKQLENLRYIEPSDRNTSQMVGQFDNPHRVSMGIIYEVPSGKATGMLKKVIGGWQWSSMYIYQTGAAVGLPSVLATGVSPGLSNANIDHWFSRDSMKVLPPFTARRIPFYWSGLRVPPINNWDMGFIKNTMVYKERMKLQFRLEMINAFNRVWFGGLNTSVTSPLFTQLTGQANQPRNIQLGLKLNF